MRLPETEFNVEFSGSDSDTIEEQIVLNNPRALL